MEGAVRARVDELDEDGRGLSFDARTGGAGRRSVRPPADVRGVAGRYRSTAVGRAVAASARLLIAAGSTAGGQR